MVGVQQPAAAVANDGSHLQRPLHRVATRLQLGQPEAGVDAARAGHQVEVLPGGHLGAQLPAQGPGPPGAPRGQLVDEAVRPHQAQVAGQQRPRPAEGLRVTREPLLGVPVGQRPMQAGAPSPHVGAVHQVVVHEGAAVQQLQGGARPHHVLVAGASGVPVPDRSPPAPVAEGGSDALAPGQNQLAQGLHQGTELGYSGVEHRLLRPGEGGDQLLLDPGQEGQVVGSRAVGDGRRHGPSSPFDGAKKFTYRFCLSIFGIGVPVAGEGLPTTRPVKAAAGGRHRPVYGGGYRVGWKDVEPPACGA